MNRQSNKKRTYKKRTNTHKRHAYKKRTYKKRINTRKKRTYINQLTPNSNSSIFSVPDKKYSDKIVIDTHHKQSGNIIPGLRTYLGNV